MARMAVRKVTSGSGKTDCVSYVKMRLMIGDIYGFL